MTYEDVEARRIYDNCVRSGVPVIAWGDFVDARSDLSAADDEFRAAIQEASDRLDAIEPLPRYPGWQGYCGDEARAIDDLLLWAAEINNAHPSDFRFQLTYGKSPRNPLGHMAAKARKLRAAAHKIRNGLGRGVVKS